jgi:hypothetical protein
MFASGSQNSLCHFLDQRGHGWPPFSIFFGVSIDRYHGPFKPLFLLLAQ